MATDRDPIVIEEKEDGSGGIRARVQFFVAGRTLPRKIDQKIGERIFSIDAEAREVLRKANENLNRALKSFPGQSDNRDVKPFDIGMAIYLYTRKHKAPDLPLGDVLIDGNVMRTLAKKFL